MKLTFYGLWEEEKPKLQELSEKYGFEYAGTNEVLCPENLSLCDGSAGVSALGKRAVDEALLSELARRGIRYLSTRSIGYNHIDLKAAKKFGIRLCNSQYPPDSVAEFTVMLILMCLSRKTVGVVGTGGIGGRVVGLLSGFGCRILCHSEAVRPEIAKAAEYVDLPALYKESDVITYHLPLTSATRHMLNREALAGMKDGVILVNTARGELFETEALIEGVENRKIGALAMDVFEGEDGIYHVDRTDDILRNRNMAYLRQFPNVVLTQHMAFYTMLSMESMIENSVEGLLGFIRSGQTKFEVKF